MNITPEQILEEVKSITSDFVGASLCNSQNFPNIRYYEGGISEVSISGKPILSVALKGLSYSNVYYELMHSKAYNIKMLDGALIQIMYRFLENKVVAHRLAFFPSPDLEEFQNAPDIYELDEIYAEVVNKGVVVFPFRFDFDARDEVVKDVDHPMSHLTLGQYSNCRIPVTSPLTPNEFVGFILRNFYHTAHRKYHDGMRRSKLKFADTITDNEKQIIHLIVS